jgi:hypothetical protein
MIFSKIMGAGFSNHYSSSSAAQDFLASPLLSKRLNLCKIIGIDDSLLRIDDSEYDPVLSGWNSSATAQINVTVRCPSQKISL